MHAVHNLILTSHFGMQYNLEYYLEMADALISHGVHTLAIKDMVRSAMPSSL